mmetsp:Transcript_66561/g.131932  ORF Transcript_66561/g.131932 Transcript_66561/m.131932 type:complete len:129 (-) Transcript_66561:3184-3570(-)
MGDFSAPHITTPPPSPCAHGYGASMRVRGIAYTATAVSTPAAAVALCACLCPTERTALSHITLADQPTVTPKVTPPQPPHIPHVRDHAARLSVRHLPLVHDQRAFEALTAHDTQAYEACVLLGGSFNR